MILARCEEQWTTASRIRAAPMHRSRIRLTRARGVVGKPQPAPARVAFATVDRQRFQSLGPWRGSPAMRRVRQRAEQTARTCRARKAMQRRCVEAGRWQRFDVAWPLARLAGKAASAAEGRSNRENRGARNRCNEVARIGQLRRLTRFGSFVTTPLGAYGQARTADHSQDRRAPGGARTRPRRQIRRKINGLGRKTGFSSKGTGWRSKSRAAAGC